MQPDDAALRRENEYLRQLFKLNLELDFDKLLEFVLETLLALSGGRGGFLAVVEDGAASVKAVRRFPREQLAQATLSLAGKAPLLLPASDLLPGAAAGERLYYVPIATETTVHAAAFLQPGATLPQGEDLASLLDFCAQAAVSVENFHLFKTAMYDKSTGLYSLTNVLSRLEEELSRTARYKRKLTLLLVEIDRYSLLADIHGPGVAAKVLRSVVEIARRSVRKADVVGRYSEQVIAVLLPETPLPQAQLITKRIQDQVGELDLSDGKRKLELGVSIAAVAYPNDGKDAQGLLQRAEDILTIARRAGGRRTISSKELSREDEESHPPTEIDYLVLSREGRALLAMITRMVNARELELGRLLEHVIESLVELMRAERGMIALVRDGKIEAETQRYGKAGAGAGPAFAFDEKAVEQAIAEKRIMVYPENPPKPAPTKKGGPNAYLAAPVEFEGKVIGIVYFENNAANRRFIMEDVEFISSSLMFLSGVIHNARVYTQQKKDLAEAKEVLATSLETLKTKYSYSAIVGKSKPMQEIFRILDKVTDTGHPVLITGESGTGKELVARAIHYNGPRKTKPFVAENVGALPGTLLEAELFGYVRGAFTGAVSDKKGLLEVANMGSLFLDEVGEMSLDLQKKLLRVLEEKEFRPLGGREIIRSVDIRIISATNRELRKLCETGEFREDLYYRLNVVSIKLPPLRDRKEDVPLLVERFLAMVAEETGKPKKKLDDDAMRMLMGYHWPGNIRELENTLKNACVFTEGLVLDRKSFAHFEKFRDVVPVAVASTASAAAGAPRSDQTYVQLQQELEEREKQYMLGVLEQSKQNKLRAAQVLGITRPALYRAMRRLGIRE